MSPHEIKISKFLSLVLRHQPQSIGIQLEQNGWTDVDELIRKANQKGVQLDRQLLEHIVQHNDKKRFSFNEDHTKIRANQGHSIEVDLHLPVQVPPEILYHGTATRNTESIKKEGLKKGQRHHVHLSDNAQTAHQVGQRYGKPVVLVIEAGKMHADGWVFYCSENGVWLTDHVPSQYIQFAES